MKIFLIMTGKTRVSWLQKGMDDYLGRLTHYIPLELVTTPDLKNTRSMPANEQKEREGMLIKKSIPQGSMLVLLDDRGKEYSSEEFAGFIEKKMNEGRDICMVIGGAYGFSDDLYQMADLRLSLIDE